MHNCIVVWKIISYYRLENWIPSSTRIFNERNQKNFFGFSVNSICQVAINEYLDIVSINKISSFYQEKEITFDSFWQIVGLNYSRVKGLIFKLPLTKLFQRDCCFCKRLIIEYGGGHSYFNLL
jgi:hypothetical protein